MDFTLLKYLFAMTEKTFDIDGYLKLSNIENVYSLFNQFFRVSPINNEINDQILNNKIANDDQNNFIMQLKFLI